MWRGTSVERLHTESAEWLLIADTDFGAFNGLVQAEDVYAAMSHAHRCGACGRLHVFWTGSDDEPTVYSIEA